MPLAIFIYFGKKSKEFNTAFVCWSIPRTQKTSSFIQFPNKGGGRFCKALPCQLRTKSDFSDQYTNFILYCNKHKALQRSTRTVLSETGPGVPRPLAVGDCPIGSPSVVVATPSPPPTTATTRMRGVGARSRDARAATDSATNMHTPHAVAQFWGAESDTTWRI